jgi:hypothetical protein
MRLPEVLRQRGRVSPRTLFRDAEAMGRFWLKQDWKHHAVAANQMTLFVYSTSACRRCANQSIIYIHPKMLLLGIQNKLKASSISHVAP